MTGERVTIEPTAGSVDASTPAEVAGGWTERQVTALREHADRLRHEVEVLRSALHDEQRSVATLQSTLTAIEEHVRRHEAEQQTVRATQQRVQAALEGSETVISRLNERVQALEQRSWSADSMHRESGVDAEEAALTPSRMEELENRVAALMELAMQGRQAKERLDLSLPEITASISQLDAAAETLRNELRRTGDELAQERARRDRESELLELIDQQRSTRIRIEERLALYGEHLEEARGRLGAAAEERGALARQLARTDERVLTLSEALDMQHAAVIDHFQRLLEAEREASDKQVQGLESRLREGQQLLTRLREAGETRAPEQPL